MNPSDLYRGKRLGIMQPYFFPYLGYFGLIAHTDRWIVFDGVQYMRKSWIARNRVLKAGGGEKYLSLDVIKAPLDRLIRDMRIAKPEAQLDRIRNNLDAYKLLRAPYREAVIDLLERCFKVETDQLAPFLAHCLAQTCSYIGIPFNCEIYSRMNIDHPPAESAADWAFHISTALGAGAYINPPGGRAFFDPERFRRHGVEFHYYEQELPSYNQKGTEFIPGLSIIDVMMFNSPEQIRDMLGKYRLAGE